MKPVDCHCHLFFDQFDDDRKEVIDRAGEELDFVVVAGTDFEGNRKTIELSEKYPDFVIPNLGLHPTSVEDFDQLEEIKQQIRSKDPAAVGEIGLDHYHVKEKETRQRQEDVFEEMLELAEELEKPVVVHSREAEERAIEILKEYKLPGVMLHCFNGSPKLAEKAAENDMKIGVTTQVLYSNRVQEIAEKIALENTLLETDSPFLYTEGRNEPVKVLESIERISELKSVPEKKVIQKTARNARELFL